MCRTESKYVYIFVTVCFTEQQKSEVGNILTIVSSGIDSLDVEVVSIGIICIHCSLIAEDREYQYHHYLKIQ